MTVYCIKTADIPAEELNQWKDIGYLLEDSAIKSNISLQAYSNHWFIGVYILIAPEEYPYLVASNTPPKQPYLPLTLSILKTLAFLKLTGDCNDPNNTLSLSSTTED